MQAVLTVRRFANDKSTIRAWETANKVQIALARALRLMPRSRISPKTATRKGKAYKPSFYDTMDLEDETNPSDD